MEAVKTTAEEATRNAMKYVKAPPNRRRRKSTLATFLFLLSILTSAACDQNSPSLMDGNENAVTENTESMRDTVIIKLGLRSSQGLFLMIKQQVHSRRCYH